MRRIVLLLLAVTFAGCGSSDETDTGIPDAANGDGTTTGSYDAGGRADAGARDGGGDASNGNRDAGGVDSGLDAGPSSDANGADANGGDSSAGDATTADANANDASGVADAASDAAADAGVVDAADGSVSVGSPCGDARGLQPGAPWPMRGRCPTRMARADVAGPARVNLAWKRYTGPNEGDITNYKGIVSSPVVAADGTIYVGVEAGGLLPGGLLAYAPDGTPKWHYDTGHESGRSGAVVRADGSVVFASSDGTLVALEPTGQLRWSTALGARASASPLVGPDGTIYEGTDNGMVAVRGDGQMAWSNHDCPTVSTGGGSLHPDGSIRYNCQTDVRSVSPTGASEYPSLGTDGEVLHGPPTIGPSGEVWYASVTPAQMVSPHATLWSYTPAIGLQRRDFDWQVDAFFNGPALLASGDAVIGAPDSMPPNVSAQFVSASIAGGYHPWATYALGIATQPSVDANGNVYFVSGTTLVSLGPGGAPRWSAPLDSDVQYGVAIGADGTLYVGTVNGWLYAFAP